MKSARGYLAAIGLFLLILLVLLPVPGQAQQSNSSAAFTREQLAQMLAPIALYPDPLLSQVLTASTYPIEVVEADRWVKNHPGLKGEDLNQALLDQDWAPSVKALCHFPPVLAMMSERIGETTTIGNAFLAQEGDVMSVVQELRQKAHEQGTLTSNPEQKVIVEKQTIVIEPVNPQVIYVPYYDPLTVYGPWWYPAYPPYYWGPAGVTLGVGISYWPGFFLGFSFGAWSYFDWPRHSIYINVRHRPRYVRRDRWRARSGPWHHAPRHRRGVAYRDIFTARKYGQYPRHPRTFGPAVRGFPERRTPSRVERNRQEQRRIERERRLRQQTRPARPAPQRPVRQRPPSARPAPQRPQQTRPARQRPQQTRQRAEQERQRQIREQVDRNVFNRVDEGRREREWSRRGQFSREGRRGGEPRSQRPSGRSDRGRMRR